MRCGHCQNWQISRPKGDDGSVGAAGTSHPRGGRVRAARGVPQGIAFTYNEPVIWLEYVLDAGRLARASGLFTVMVTNGYVTPAGLDAFAEVDRRVACRHQGRSRRSRSSGCATCGMPRRSASRRCGRSACTACTSSASPTSSRPSTTPRTSCGRSRAGSRPSWAPTRRGTSRGSCPTSSSPTCRPTPLATLERAREIGREEGLRLRLPRQRRRAGRRGHRLPRVWRRSPCSRRGFDVLAENLADERRVRVVRR